MVDLKNYFSELGSVVRLVDGIFYGLERDFVDTYGFPFRSFENSLLDGAAHVRKYVIFILSSLKCRRVVVLVALLTVLPESIVASSSLILKCSGPLVTLCIRVATLKRVTNYTKDF